MVLDVMKPFEPNLISYANEITSLDTVDAVNIALLETDREVQNIKITLEGDHINFEEVSKKIEDLAGAIHSIDMIAAGSKTISPRITPQDHNS
jgi:hypothetical protein